MATKQENIDVPLEESPDLEKNVKKCVESLSTQSKICGVCGDKALGYNFNAISCESCKAFFRRNALLSKSFKCPFNEQCEITTITRRFCQKCRLEKCFSIGMVKEYIMSEEDKAEKRKKIEQNRAKRQYPRSDDTNVVTSSKTMKIDDSNDSISYNQPNSVKFSSPRSEEDSNATSDSTVLNVQYNVLNSTTNSPNPLQNLNDNISETQNQTTSYIEVPMSYPGVLRRNFVINPENSIQQEVINQNQSINESHSQNQSPYPSYTVNLEDDSNELSGSRGVTFKSILTSVTNGDLEFTLGHPRKQYHCDISQEGVPSTSTIDMENKARDILEDVERIPIEPNSIESILCEAIKLEFEAYSSVSQGKNSSRELNEVERAKLNELIVANKALHAPLDDDISVLVAEATALKGSHSKHDPKLVSIINLTAVAIRRLIKMAKKINAFKNMCEEDQVALLKGGCTEMMILRSTMTYDTARNTWKIPHSQEALSSIKADVLKLAKGDIYHEHERFIRTFEPRWRTDENIILIMSAILLFTHHRPRVVHSDVIKLEQNSYYYLLRRYLESVYPGCEAKSTFLKLIQKIMELHKLADEVIGVYLDVNPIEPLLIEIFDLKHTTI